MECLIAVALLLAGLASYAAGAKRADGTARTLIWAAAAGLFVIAAFVVGVNAMGHLGSR